MKLKHFPLAIVVLLLLTELGFADSGSASSELIGTWQYSSFAVLKPFGTVHFQPGQWTVTFKTDATWDMEPWLGKPGGLHGTYVLLREEIEMKLTNGSPYEKYRFEIQQDGKVLILKSKENAISASRVE